MKNSNLRVTRFFLLKNCGLEVNKVIKLLINGSHTCTTFVNICKYPENSTDRIIRDLLIIGCNSNSARDKII